MDLIFYNYKSKILLDKEKGFFYIEDNLGNLKEKIHILDIHNNLVRDNFIFSVMSNIYDNIIKECKMCNIKFIGETIFCNYKCKKTYQYRLRVHQQYLLSDEINSIKNRVTHCEYCNIRLIEKQADHILPLKEYKNNHYDNIAIVCKSCNSSKRDKDLLSWAESKNIILPRYIINHYYWLKRLDK